MSASFSITRIRHQQRHHFKALCQKSSTNLFSCFVYRSTMHYICVTCLSACHEVSLGLDYRNGIFLNRSWSGVATQSDVAHDDLTHVHILELLDCKHTQKHLQKEFWKQSLRPIYDAVLLVNTSSLHSQCGEGSSVLLPRQECHHTSQS